MPSIQKTAAGYRVQVYVKGQRDSASFRTKREAEAWGFSRESELEQSAPIDRRYTLKDAMGRYVENVSPTKRGRRWEEVRIAAFLKDKGLPVSKKLCDISPDDFGRWRDERIKSVSAGTVLREISLLSAIIETARREWRWIQHNPLSDIRKPKTPDHRTTIIKPLEAVKLLRAMSYHSGPCKSSTQAVSIAFVWALHCGMRAGEICSLRWSDVTEDSFVTGSKTQSSRRTLPTDRRINLMLDRLRGWDSEFVFGIKAQTLDSLFRRYRDRAGLGHIHFHDTRHTAATRLAQRLDVLTLCKYFGWRDPRYAMIYYNPTANDLREQLERGQSRKQVSAQTRLA